ncbi:MAG: bifunctional phosphopantothenoylcysteine decarboxylase/phosphopantothenate--cysteine ligase CoaBC [Anaerolineales bacterium]|nr:MAG: bifunctional phosphopantothenoylcysteine decarboxylase/phosphopantothenate--cysteine ligase CoaBC [Anaerolineales bacterium]
MTQVLRDKHIILGITGGIAAYKAAEVASRLVKARATVDVVMTEAATKFVTPLTFQALTHHPVITEMFALLRETEIGHVSLAQRADLLIIAPATANTMAKLATGLADNMLTATALGTQAPILLAPAMETKMWENPLTQDNMARLQKMRDVTVVGPGAGRLASGGMGPGRMAEPAEIVAWARIILGRGGPLAGQRVLVTTGGTQEPIDPVRFIGNHSSGKMGYALVLSARDRGAKVTLVSAPTALPAPVGMQLVAVQTAQEMQQAVLEALPESDALIMAAAVADYRPTVAAAHKIKKGETGLELELVRTSDILAEVATQRAELGWPRVVVGFAAETQDLVANAQAKLKAKRLDLMVANDARQAMGADVNRVTLLDASGGVEELPLLPKEEVAERVMDRVVELLRGGLSTD